MTLKIEIVGPFFAFWEDYFFQDQKSRFIHFLLVVSELPIRSYSQGDKFWTTLKQILKGTSNYNS